jgi:phage/plasmid-like protein (TIGR03299 family)
MLRGGQDFWALASIGDGYDITGHGDRVKPYVLLSNNHTNKRAGRLQLTSIRVVCANTEGFARNQADENKALYRPVSIYHTGDVLAKAYDATAFLGIAKAAADEQAELFRDMSRKVLTMADAQKLLETVYPSPLDAKRDHNKVERELIIDLWQGGGAGADLQGVRGTLWGLYNAATESVNHWQGAESKKEESERLAVKFETLQLTSAAAKLDALTVAFAGAL